MSYDTGLRMLGLQAAEQSQQSPFLARRARVGRIAVAVEAALIAHAQRVCVGALRMRPDELFMPRLVAVVTIPKDVTVASTLEIHDLNDSQALLKSYSALKGGEAK